MLRGWTHINALCLLICYFTQAQESNTLTQQLQEIEQLIDQNDTSAIERLDLIHLDVGVTHDSITIWYFKLKGDYYLSNDQFEAAVEAYEQLVEFDQRSLGRFTSKQLARGINDLGIALMRTGAFDEARQAHYKSLKIYERLNDPQGAAFNYNNLAVLFQSLKQKRTRHSTTFRKAWNTPF